MSARSTLFLKRVGSQIRTPMIDEHNLVLFSRSEGDAYKSSQAAELSLNAAILRAEISRSYEEFLDIFETFYDDDVEVSRSGKGESTSFSVECPGAASRNGRGCRIVDISSADCSSWRHRQRDAFRMEDRLRRRRRQTLHLEMVRDSKMECVQGCIRRPLRSSADRRTPDHGRPEFGFGSFGGRFRLF